MVIIVQILGKYIRLLGTWTLRDGFLAQGARSRICQLFLLPAADLSRCQEVLLH